MEKDKWESSIIRNFLNKEECKDSFEYLESNISWKNELNITGSDKVQKINRKMSYVTDEKVDYFYDKFYFKGETWNPILLNIKDKVETSLNRKFNSVLLNLYEDGKDEIRWHSDKEETLGENPVIACINLGVTRKFWFLEKETGKKFFYEVSDGDLLIMWENCQKNYLHAILKEKEVEGKRISLTYRWNYD